MALLLPYVPVLKKSCCCTLRTGSLVLGWLAMISSVFKFVLIIMIFINIQQPYHEHNEEGDTLQNVFQHQTGDNTFESLDTHTTYLTGVRARVTMLNYESRYFIVLSVLGVLVFIESIFTIMLLHGIHYEKPSCMQPFLLWTLFALVSTLLCSVIRGVYIAVDNVALGLAVIPFAFLLSLIAQYLWSVLYSHYRELEDARNEGFKYAHFENEKKVIV